MNIDNIEIFADYQLIAQYALNNDLLINPTEIGVAKRLIEKGYPSLSEKQKDVFRTYILPHGDKECKWCGIKIPPSELDYNDTVCSYCQHKYDKLMNE